MTLRTEAFAEFLDQAVARNREKTIHVILDNLAVHKTPAAKAWAAAHPPVQFHFTPSFASWLNQAEIWLGVIIRDCVRRGMFHSAPELIHRIMNYFGRITATPDHFTGPTPTEQTHPCFTFFSNTTLVFVPRQDPELTGR